jgi:DNA polymerase-1
MNVLALDTEGPCFSDKEPWKGNVYGDPSPLVCFSYASADIAGVVEKWDDEAADIVQQLLDKYSLVVGFNFKHDVAWLRRHGVNFSNVRIWDVQLAEFVLSRQHTKFPSLADTCLRYGIEPKQDVVKSEYWDKGIDTKDIPWSVLSEYAAHDASITLQCYHAQLGHLSPAQKKLVSLMSQDLLVLQEMEQNGIAFDAELCKQKELELDNEIFAINETLSKVYPDITINFNSTHQLSAFLYGGTIREVVKVLDGFYKGGARAGQPKLKNKEIEHVFPRLFIPVKGSELATEGLYGTNEGVLKKLKALDKKNNYIVAQLLKLAKLEKLNGTYYKGLPKLNEEMHWPKGKLHGTLNQTLAVSGRLSSSKPNQQNFASELQDIFVSQYP